MRDRECLPIDQLLVKLHEVEDDVASFYERARDLTHDPEVTAVFADLLAGNRRSRELTEQVRRSLEAGEQTLADNSREELGFLTALAESVFYSRTGRPVDLADPALQAEHMLENAIKIERDLLLFYMKLFGLSCAAHKPLFSELIQRCQRHIGTLQKTRRRLA